MSRRKGVWVVLAAWLVGAAVPVLAQQVVVHEPWLNWDFFNQTGQDVNDFEIVVEAADFNPSETFGMPFAALPVVTHLDVDGDLDLDTTIHWSGAAIPPGGMAHIGAFMAGSGPIMDAYWTLDGVKVGTSLPITYELTRVTFPTGPEPGNPGGEPWLGMRLNYPSSFFDVLPAGATVGWTGIRTFADIPADILSLGDLNETLALGGLLAYETMPRVGDPSGVPILPVDTIWVVDSFFDVFVDIPLVSSPEFESLLFAQIVVDPDGPGSAAPALAGQFWNLNSQCPEPSTGLLIGLLGLTLGLRRRSRGSC